MPCSRTQRRRARATSARLRSAARRLFFDSDAVASKEPGERAPASWDSPLVQRRNNLTQREVRLLTDEGENPLRVLLQWRSTPSTGYWLAGPVVAKALHPSDRGTDADVELFGRFTSGPSSFHEANDPHSQLTRIRSMHWSTLRRINALDLLLRQTLGIPIYTPAGTCCRGPKCQHNRGKSLRGHRGTTGCRPRRRPVCPIPYRLDADTPPRVLPGLCIHTSVGNEIRQDGPGVG